MGTLFLLVAWTTRSISLWEAQTKWRSQEAAKRGRDGSEEAPVGAGISAPAGPSTPVRGGKRRARDPLLQPQAKVGTGTGISDAGMGIRQEGRGIVQTVEEQGDSQGAQANPVIGKGISVSAVQSGQGEARAGALPSERLQTEQEQREGANSDGREAEGPMEASGTYGDSNAQGMGQGTREAEGTGLRQQPVTGEPAWLREMRARYGRHDAMTPAGVVSGRNALVDVSIVTKPPT